jgi:hypothetical protein
VTACEGQTLSDRLVFTPDDVDLSRSPLSGKVEAETYVLGAFNPGLAVLPGGNLLLMVRIAEALKTPIVDGAVRSIRWTLDGYNVDTWPLETADTSDPRAFKLADHRWPTLGLTSLSWLLPVELSADGTKVIAVHYDKAIAPCADHQCYGVEDPRISTINGRYYMTACAVSPERQAAVLYISENGLDWRYQGIVLDHQNKDMLIFEGLIDGKFWAQTRPLGDLYFAYPPDSPWLNQFGFVAGRLALEAMRRAGAAPANGIAAERAHGRRRAAYSDRSGLVEPMARGRADRTNRGLSHLLGRAGSKRPVIGPASQRPDASAVAQPELDQTHRSAALHSQRRVHDRCHRRRRPLDRRVGRGGPRLSADLLVQVLLVAGLRVSVRQGSFALLSQRVGALSPRRRGSEDQQKYKPVAQPVIYVNVASKP